MCLFFSNIWSLIWDSLKTCNQLELLTVIATWWALYYQFLKPFTPFISLNGRYKLSINPIGNRTYQTAITFGINFINSGARVGFIDDVLLKLTCENESIKYIAVFNDLNEKVSFQTSAASPPKELEYAPFASFEVSGHTSISREVFFVPYDHSTPRLKPAEYNVSIYVRDSKNNSFKEVENTKIIIEQTDYESYPPWNTLEEALKAYTQPYVLRFFTQSKILPEKDELIKKIK